MELSTLNTTLGCIETNEPNKLPAYTLTADGKPYARLQAVTTINGQEASGKTLSELVEAAKQGHDVAVKYTEILPDAE